MQFYQISNWIKSNLSKIPLNHRKIISALVYGLMLSKRIGVACIGRAMKSKTTPRHNIKRVARYLENKRINIHQSMEALQYKLCNKKELLLISIDWTVLSDNGYQVLKATVVGDGRGIPIAYKTYKEESLKDKQTVYEIEMIEYLRTIIPEKTKVIIIGDRGFGRKSMLMASIEKNRFYYVLRTKENIKIKNDKYHGLVLDYQTEKEHIYELKDVIWPGFENKTKKKKEMKIKSKFVITQKKNCKERWILATNLYDMKAEKIIKIYYKRMTIEETFKDEKNLLYGFALEKMKLSSAERYDKMLLIICYAYLFLTLLGVLMEKEKMHRKIMANTVKHRTFSLFQVGLFYFKKYDYRISKLLKLLDNLIYVLE